MRLKLSSLLIILLFIIQASYVGVGNVRAATCNSSFAVSSFPSSPTVGTPIKFTPTVCQDQANHYPDEAFWSFGDTNGIGQFEVVSPVSHSYQEAGSYVVSLTLVYTLEGVQAVVSNSVNVGPRPSLSAFTVAPPKIDGWIPDYNNPDEWTSADSLDFVTVNGRYQGTIYVMNDNTNLYIGVKINYAYLPLTSLTIFFDNNLTRQVKVGDDVLHYAGSHEYYFDQFISDASGGASIESDTQDRGTLDGDAALASDGTFNYYEFSKPLCSQDTRHDFCLSTGQTVGFGLQYAVNQGTTIDTDTWPSAYLDASGYADIVVASETFRFQVNPKAPEMGQPYNVTMFIKNTERVTHTYDISVA